MKINIYNIHKTLLYFTILYLLLMEMTIVPKILDNLTVNFFNSKLFVLLSIVTIIAAFKIRRFSYTKYYFKKNIFFLIFIATLLVITLDTINVVYFYTGMTSQLLWLIKTIALFLLITSTLLAYGKSLAISQILNPYIHLVFYISLTSILAYILFFLFPIDLASFSPDYLKKNEEGNNETGLYFFPYYLGLILTGESAQYIFGIPLVRGSGLSIEPSVSTLLATPALFLVNISSFRRKYLFKAILVVFLLLNFSVLNLTILLLIGILILLRRRSILILIFIGVTALFFAVEFFEQIYNQASILRKFDFNNSSNKATVGMLVGRLNSEHLIGYGFFSSRDASVEPFKTSIVTTIIILLIFLIGIIAFVFRIFYKKNYAVYLAVLYLFLYSFKSIQHVIFLQYFIFLILIAMVATIGFGKNKETNAKYLNVNLIKKQLSSVESE